MPVKKTNNGYLAIAALVGVVCGLALYTFVYAQGTSYLSNDSSACANCHIMREQYDGWLKSSHRAVATCNDCHMPHQAAQKYVMKMVNGVRHSYAFTSGDFHEPIQLGATNRAVTEAACVACHREMASAILHRDKGDCIPCHRSVGHLH